MNKNEEEERDSLYWEFTGDRLSDYRECTKWFSLFYELYHDLHGLRERNNGRRRRYTPEELECPSIEEFVDEFANRYNYADMDADWSGEIEVVGFPKVVEKYSTLERFR